MAWLSVKPDIASITQHIEQATGESFAFESMHPLSGGDINTAFHLQSKQHPYFVKLNRRELLPMFQAESLGLSELAQTNSLRIPQPITCGQTTEHAFLVLEYIAFGAGHSKSATLFGEQLAHIHQHRQPYFGWHTNNTIGSNQQINTPNDHWLEFWRVQRLQPQLNLAAQNGYYGKLQPYGELLCLNLSAFFPTYQPQPSLVHGDLWQGNAAFDQHGRPVIFDPACYYADRETDLAMTELFGGFSPNFYAAYNSIWSLDQDYAVRKNLYNLYHIINHLNLFGGSYLRQAEHMLAQLLAEIK